MKLAAGQALTALNALQNMKFSEEASFLDTYKVARLINRLSQNPDIQAAEKAQRDLVTKFGKKGESGISLSPRDENFPAYVEAFTAISGEMIDLNGAKKLSIETLKNVIGARPFDIVPILPFIEEEDDDVSGSESDISKSASSAD
jgi:hypothetical protein